MSVSISHDQAPIAMLMLVRLNGGLESSARGHIAAVS